MEAHWSSTAPSTPSSITIRDPSPVESPPTAPDTDSTTSPKEAPNGQHINSDLSKTAPTSIARRRSSSHATAPTHNSTDPAHQHRERAIDAPRYQVIPNHSCNLQIPPRLEESTTTSAKHRTEVPNVADHHTDRTGASNRPHTAAGPPSLYRTAPKHQTEEPAPTTRADYDSEDPTHQHREEASTDSNPAEFETASTNAFRPQVNPKHTHCLQILPSSVEAASASPANYRTESAREADHDSARTGASSRPHTAADSPSPNLTTPQQDEEPAPTSLADLRIKRTTGTKSARNRHGEPTTSTPTYYRTEGTFTTDYRTKFSITNRILRSTTDTPSPSKIPTQENSPTADSITDNAQGFANQHQRRVHAVGQFQRSPFYTQLNLPQILETSPHRSAEPDSPTPKAGRTEQTTRTICSRNKTNSGTTPALST